jgi:hypothetical protein
MHITVLLLILRLLQVKSRLFFLHSQNQHHYVESDNSNNPLYSQYELKGHTVCNYDIQYNVKKVDNYAEDGSSHTSDSTKVVSCTQDSHFRFDLKFK